MEQPVAEHTLWKGSTSQWVHVKFYSVCVLLAAGCIAGTVITAGLSAIGLIVPVVAALVRWWITKCTVFEVTSERLLVITGVLNRREEVLELYRVRDYTLEQPFLLRLFNLGNITLVTSDVVTPNVTITAVPDAVNLRDKLRNAVEASRDRKRVRQMDVDSLDGGSLDGGHGQ